MVATPSKRDSSKTDVSAPKNDFSTTGITPPVHDFVTTEATPPGSDISTTEVSPDFSITEFTPPTSDFSSNVQDLPALYLESDLPPLQSQIINAPYEYIASLPSKGLRSVFTSALNHWLSVPESDIREINEIVAIFHNASLMVDDIQDESALRRSRPSTHMVFGVAQTINSAMFYVNEGMASVQRVCGSKGVQIALNQLSVLYTGQSYDIHSSQNMCCPTVEEYIRTIDGKTGGLFELNARLMVLKTPSEVDYAQLRRLVILIGRYYQLRDDYTSIQLSAQDKPNPQQPAAPWCEDLDGGKYTLPIIHLIESGQGGHLIQSILSTRHATGKMEDASKHILLDYLQQASCLEYTASVLEAVHQETVAELDRVNEMLGHGNLEMRYLIDKLKL